MMFRQIIRNHEYCRCRAMQIVTLAKATILFVDFTVTCTFWV